jgi:hypothetical protein
MKLDLVLHFKVIAAAVTTASIVTIILTTWEYDYVYPRGLIGHHWEYFHGATTTTTIPTRAAAVIVTTQG